VDDIVAVAIKLESGEHRYFLTWGRIFDRIDGSRLEELAMQAAGHVQLEGTAVSAHLCDSLQEAAGERYFYESFFEISQQPIRRDDYEAWKAEKAKALAEGHGWYYLGVPKKPAPAH
jgi:hypothetical protein